MISPITIPMSTVQDDPVSSYSDSSLFECDAEGDYPESVSEPEDDEGPTFETTTTNLGSFTVSNLFVTFTPQHKTAYSEAVLRLRLAFTPDAKAPASIPEADYPATKHIKLSLDFVQNSLAEDPVQVLLAAPITAQSLQFQKGWDVTCKGSMINIESTHQTVFSPFVQDLYVTLLIPSPVLDISCKCQLSALAEPWDLPSLSHWSSVFDRHRAVSDLHRAMDECEITRDERNWNAVVRKWSMEYVQC